MQVDQQEGCDDIFQRLWHLFSNSNPFETIDFDIDVTDLVFHDQIRLGYFKKNPSDFLTSLIQNLRQKTLRKVIGQNDHQEQKKILQNFRKLENLSIRLKYIPYSCKIYKSFGSLSSDDVGRWIVITGTVIQSLQKKTLEKSKNFACSQCGHLERIRTDYHNSYRFQAPPSCTNRIQKQKSKNIISQLYLNLNKRKNFQQAKSQNQKQESKQSKLQKCGCYKYEPIQQDKICIDYQQIRIQEQFQFISSGKIPQTITVLIEGSLSQQTLLRPGDDLTISGLLTYRYKKVNKDFKLLPQLIIYANSIVIEKTGNNVSNSQQNADQFSETQMSRIYSGFPLNVYSEFELTSKERLLIKQLEFRRQILDSFSPNIYGRNMVKLGLLVSLLGGVSLENQSSKIRGHSHVLLVGEPGTGKSVLLKQIAKLADRSFFTNGIGTTSAGLSVSYYKEGGDWMIEAGALVLADNGICCIDQLTLLSKKDEKSLLQSMQQQTISSAKASVVGKLNARTTVICACNPIRPGQKYDEQLDLEANTGLSIPLLTRFDMIFIMKDEKDYSEDAEKCDHILGKFCNQQKQFLQRKGTNQRMNLKGLLKKCKSLNPVLQSNQLLTIYYSDERSRQSKVKTARAFESLCRISEAHAKLMLRESTILLDYVTAICLIENKYFSTIEEYYSILDEFNKKYKKKFL